MEMVEEPLKDGQDASAAPKPADGHENGHHHMDEGHGHE
jgi:hypothetical protein